MLQSKSFSLYNVRLAILAFVASFALLAFAFTTNANAAGESYGYADSGAKIVGTGGSFGSATATFTKMPYQERGMDIYNGSATIKGNSGNCVIGLRVLVSPGATSGTLSAPGELNGLAGSGSAGTSYTKSCDKAYAAGLADFNKAVSVSTSGTNNPAPTPTETEGQKEIIATVYSNKKVGDLPTVQVTQLKLGTPNTPTPKNIDWNTSTNIGSARWSGATPGTYRICVKPDTLFNYFNACQDVTKVAGTPLLVNFGSSADNLNETGKQVSVKVNIAIPAGNGEVTYGPVSLTLYDNATQRAAGPTGVTSVNTIATDTGTRPAQSISVTGPINEVEPGTYKVCITGKTDLCSPAFTKAVNAQANTEINVSEEQSKEFLSDNGASSCTVEGVGWIICPIMTFMGGIVDGAYNFVSGLLKVQPLVTTGANQGIYQAWVIMRNIANLAFVIAFLIIIFSQLTSVGVSNYGVKKLLPRLVVAAILVNASFWICAIAVDLSNILGASMVQVFGSIENSISLNLSGNVNTAAEFANGGQWTELVGGILAGAAVGGAVYYVGLSALIPALLAAVVAILTVFLVLVLRQALIILLIVIAPLAFVAYLLPNTEGLFSKWRALFMTMLLMYPIIAAIFGASALASMVIMQGAEGNTIVQIMGACIALLPLALTPIVMKFAGGILNRFAGIVNDKDKGPINRLQNSARDFSKSRRNMRDANALAGQGQMGRGAYVKWRARRNAIGSGRESELNRARTDYVAQQSENNATFRNEAAGGGGRLGSLLGQTASDSATQRVLANTINTQTKLEADEVNAAKTVIEHAGLSGAQRQELALNGTIKITDASGVEKKYSGSTMQKAAIQEQFRAGSLGDMHKIVAASGSSLSDFRMAIAQGVASSGIASKNPALGGKTIDDISQGLIKNQDDLDERVIKAVNDGKFTAEAMANMHDDGRQMAIDATMKSNDAAAKSALNAAANSLLGSPELMEKISGNKRATNQINELSGF